MQIALNLNIARSAKTVTKPISHQYQKHKVPNRKLPGTEYQQTDQSLLDTSPRRLTRAVPTPN